MLKNKVYLHLCLLLSFFSPPVALILDWGGGYIAGVTEFSFKSSF